MAQSVTCTWGGVSSIDETRVWSVAVIAAEWVAPWLWDGCPLLGGLMLTGSYLVPDQNLLEIKRSKDQ